MLVPYTDCQQTGQNKVNARHHTRLNQSTRVFQTFEYEYSKIGTRVIHH